MRDGLGDTPLQLQIRWQRRGCADSRNKRHKASHKLATHRISSPVAWYGQNITKVREVLSIAAGARALEHDGILEDGIGGGCGQRINHGQQQAPTEERHRGKTKC